MNLPKYPKVGDVVLFTPNSDDSIARSNSNPEPIAAIITRVWGPICCNLKIVPDHGAMQDRGSVCHKSQNPAGYNWQYADERDLVSIDTNIDQMKYTVFNLLSSKSDNYQKDIELVEGFFEGLRTKTKINHGSESQARVD